VPERLWVRDKLVQAKRLSYQNTQLLVAIACANNSYIHPAQNAPGWKENKSGL